MATKKQTTKETQVLNAAKETQVTENILNNLATLRQNAHDNKAKVTGKRDKLHNTLSLKLAWGEYFTVIKTPQTSGTMYTVFLTVFESDVQANSGKVSYWVQGDNVQIALPVYRDGAIIDVKLSDMARATQLERETYENLQTVLDALVSPIDAKKGSIYFGLRSKLGDYPSRNDLAAQFQKARKMLNGDLEASEHKFVDTNVLDFLVWKNGTRDNKRKFASLHD